MERTAAGGLELDGRSVRDLAEELGTPFFLVSERVLDANLRALEQGLAGGGSAPVLRYCAKTNNEAGILAVVAASGWHVLVSHPAEALLALRSGFPPGRIAYQAPVISGPEIAQVLTLGVTFVHAYRAADIDVIEAAARESGKTVRVSLRLCNVWSGGPFSPVVFLSRRLGFTEEGLIEAARRIGSSSRLELAGVNGYTGTNRASAANFAPMLRRLAGVAAAVRSQTGLAVGEINLGGGIPALESGDMPSPAPGETAGDRKDEPQTLASFAGALAVRFRDEVRRAGIDWSPALAAEPGRAVVGNAVHLVTTVKAVQGGWVFVDGSRNYLPELGGILTRPILADGVTGPGRVRRYHISGNTLNTTDILGLRRRLPVLKSGDILVFGDAGAYSISRGSRYAGLLPAVYLLRADGSAVPIRRAENGNDLAGPMSLPDPGRRS